MVRITHVIDNFSSGFSVKPFWDWLSRTLCVKSVRETMWMIRVSSFYTSNTSKLFIVLMIKSQLSCQEFKTTVVSLTNALSSEDIRRRKKRIFALVVTRTICTIIGRKSFFSSIFPWRFEVRCWSKYLILWYEIRYPAKADCSLSFATFSRWIEYLDNHY